MSGFSIFSIQKFFISLIVETFAHSSILLLFCGEVVFLYVEPKTKVKESVIFYKDFRGFCKITKS